MTLCDITKQILMILLITLFVVASTGCGGGEKTPVSADSQDVNEPQAEKINDDMVEEDEYTGTGESEDLRDGDDVGEPCKEHEYIVAAGSSASLDFQILMKRKILNIVSDKGKAFTAEDITIRDSSDYWTKMKVERSEPSTYIETINSSVDRWGVRAEVMLREYEENPGEMTSIRRKLENGTKYKIKFIGNNFGIIERLGNWYPEHKVAKMTENDILEALGGVMEIEHIDNKKGNFILPIETISIDSENFILNVTYDISFPDSLPTRTKGTRLWQEVRIGDSVDVRFVLWFDYDKKRELFHVFGPWFESNCF